MTLRERLIDLLERLVAAHERQADALERLAGDAEAGDASRPPARPKKRAEPLPVSETDRAAARNQARRLGLFVRESRERR